MTIAYKIAFTLILMWFITYLSAHPDSKFSEWGRKKFSTYSTFLIFIGSIYVISLIILSIYIIWSS